MTKAEFLARMERDLDEDIETGCYAITGRCKNGEVILSGIGGSPKDIVKFATRVVKAVAKRLEQEPRVVAGAIEMLLELGGSEKSIEMDVSAMEAAAKKREDDDDEQ